MLLLGFLLLVTCAISLALVSHRQHLRSRRLSTTGAHGDDCDLTSRRNITFEITRWNSGRLGNAIGSATRAMGYAFLHHCDLLLPSQLIGISDYVTPKYHFCAEDDEGMGPVSLKAVDKQHTKPLPCNVSTPSEMLGVTIPSTISDVSLHADVRIRSRLRRYMGFNQTHSLGYKCPTSDQLVCLGVHVRSGDVFAGNFNETNGHWESSIHIHGGYEQPPLEYYLWVIRNFFSRKGHISTATVRAIVSCEDLLNPACEVLNLLAKTDDRLMFIQRPLKESLQTLTCCEEVALSLSTLSLVLVLSPRLRHLHYHGGRGDCSPKNNLGYNTSAYRAIGYNFSTWRNTEVERHNMLREYEIEEHHCVY